MSFTSPYTATQLQCPHCGGYKIQVDPSKNPVATECSQCFHRGTALDWTLIHRLKSDLAAEASLPTCQRCKNKTRTGLTRILVDKTKYDLCKECTSSLNELLSSASAMVMDPYSFFRVTPRT